MLKTELQKQTEWLKKYQRVEIPCPNCGTKFSMWGNRVPVRDSKPDMAKCPSCKLYFTDGLTLDGSRFWAVMRDLDRLSEDNLRGVKGGAE